MNATRYPVVQCTRSLRYLFCGWRQWLWCSILLLPGTGIAERSAWRHGISFFGELKYPATFTHFDYVNPEAPKGGRITLPQLGNYDNLNLLIRKGREPSGMTVDGEVLIYDRLMVQAFDESSSQYGLLAEAVRLSEDFKTVDFRLRREARWHDGKPVTAHDVAFTFDFIKQHGSPVLQQELLEIETVEVLDDLTVRFRMPSAESPRPAQTVANLVVLPRHYWQSRALTETTIQPPLGSGPYRIREVDPGRRIVYERVEDYWGRNLPVMKGRHNFDVIEYDYFASEHVIHEALKTGDVDARLEQVAKRWSTQYEFPGVAEGYLHKQIIRTERPVGIVSSIVLNLRLEKFQDIRVREALTLAYDFEWTNRVLMYDFYERIDSYFENSDMAHDGLPTEAELELLEPFRDQVPSRVFTQPFRPPQTEGVGYPRDNLLRAARLLKEAGYVLEDGVLVDGETGEPFTIDFMTLSIYRERSLMPMVAPLDRLGIKMKVRTLEVSQFLNRVGKFDFEGIIRHFPQNLVPGQELRNYWGSSASDQPYSRNTPGIRDPVVDALIEKVIEARSRDALVTATRALDRVLLWNFYIIPRNFPPGFPYVWWDKFSRPAVQPQYHTGFFDTWWFDVAKASRLAEWRQGGGASVAD